jgi:hypothetical protein
MISKKLTSSDSKVETTNSKIISSSKENTSKISSEAAITIDFNHFKLHNSALPLPDSKTCKQAQKRTLSGLEKNQIQIVQTVIHENHLLLENRFINEQMVKKLKV